MRAGPTPAPHPALEACVVVPARDEEERIGACLTALGDQTGLEPEAWELLLVLDDCRDRTRERALEVAAVHPHLSLRLLAGPGRGSGGARATGMNAASARLHALRPRGLIASTDADTRVAPDWLARQLELTGAGAQAIGGRIELCPVEREALAAAVLARHGEHSRRRFRRVLEAAGRSAVTDHWQFNGASMSLTAETYAQVGGLGGGGTHSEDEHLERILLEHGVPIERHREVRVTTSARLEGRARHGLARVLRELSES